MIDLRDVEAADNLTVMGLWHSVCDSIGLNRTKTQRARVHWIGLGANKDVMRAGLAAYRDATDDAGREAALLSIVNSYDADVKAEASNG